MTSAWRVCRDPFADLTGDGARRFGGRWNSPGHACVYAAENAALAILEVRVHLDLPFELLPDDYVLLGIDLGPAPVETLEQLPPDPSAFGTDWLGSRRSVALRVPSIIVPECANILINPSHPAAAIVAITTKRRFSFDARLLRSPG